MGQFLEERLPIGVRLGVSFSDDFDVEITQTSDGSEYRRLVHPYPIRESTIKYTQVSTDLWNQVLSLYYRCYKSFAGFRVKALDDYTTNNRTGTPTSQDQILEVITSGSVYQLQVAYGVGTALSIGKPYRTIFKPVTGTVLIAIDTQDQWYTNMWNIVDSTGRITFNANKTKAITGITQAASAVITVGASHGLLLHESVHISGVSGMTQINGLRGLITTVGATTITVDINSTGFSAYTSGGNVNTNPQTGEVVKGGCEFDIPMRFNSRIDINTLSKNVRETGELDIIELLNP